MLEEEFGGGVDGFEHFLDGADDGLGGDGVVAPGAFDFFEAG